GDVLDLEPGHGHGVHDLVDGRVGLEVLLQPGEGEFHACPGVIDGTFSISSCSMFSCPVTPRAKNSQPSKRQLRTGMAPMARLSCIGLNSMARISPPT